MNAGLTWLKTVALYALFGAQITQAQTIVDFAHTPKKDVPGQLMVLVRESHRWGEPDVTLIDSSFFTRERLIQEHNRGGFLVQYLDANLENDQDGVLRLAAPIRFKTPKALQEAQSAYKEQLTNCISENGVSACLLELTAATKRIPGSAGKVRKVLLAKDFLVMTMTTGQIVVYRAEGSYANPRPRLYLVKVPAPLSQELLYQNLVEVYFGVDFDEVVTGVNGSLGGHPFGSKLWAFNGNGSRYGDERSERRSFARALAPKSNGVFEKFRYSSISVELAPFIWDIGLAGLDQPQTVRLKIRDLSEEN